MTPDTILGQLTGTAEGQKRRYGRFDEEAIEKCLTAIEQGIPMVYAALQAGINKGTWYRHLEEDGPAGDALRTRAEIAEARGISRRCARLTLSATGRKAQFDAAGNCTMPAIPPNPGADKWMLAVRFPEHFGDRSKLEVSAPDGPIEHRFVIEYAKPPEDEPEDE